MSKQKKKYSPDESLILDTLSGLEVRDPKEEITTVPQLKGFLFGALKDRDKALKEVEKPFRKMHREVYGDEEDDEKQGLKVRVKALETVVAEQQAIITKWKTILAVVISVATVASPILVWVIKVLWKMVAG